MKVNLTISIEAITPAELGAAAAALAALQMTSGKGPVMVSPAAPAPVVAQPAPVAASVAPATAPVVVDSPAVNGVAPAAAKAPKAPKAPKAEAPKPAPAPTPVTVVEDDILGASTPAAPLTADDVKAAARACAEQSSLEHVKAIFTEFGKAKFTDFTPAEWPALVERLRQG